MCQTHGGALLALPLTNSASGQLISCLQASVPTWKNEIIIVLTTYVYFEDKEGELNKRIPPSDWCRINVQFMWAFRRSTAMEILFCVVDQVLQAKHQMQPVTYTNTMLLSSWQQQRELEAGSCYVKYHDIKREPVGVPSIKAECLTTVMAHCSTSVTGLSWLPFFFAFVLLNPVIPVCFANRVPSPARLWNKMLSNFTPAVHTSVSTCQYKWGLLWFGESPSLVSTAFWFLLPPCSWTS